MDNPEKQIPAVVEQKDGYIEITFSDQIPRGMIENQVRECQSGTCECCTPEFRSNLESFEIVPDDQTKVRVTGKITKEQILTNILSCAPKLE